MQKVFAGSGIDTRAEDGNVGRTVAVNPDDLPPIIKPHNPTFESPNYRNAPRLPVGMLSSITNTSSRLFANVNYCSKNIHRLEFVHHFLLICLMSPHCLSNVLCQLHYENKCSYYYFTKYQCVRYCLMFLYL